MAKVENNEANLRDLLTSVYVAVIGYIPTQGEDTSRHPRPNPVSDKAWEALADTLLDAAEGRDFAPLELPWPNPD